MNNLQETPARELRKIWSGPHFLNKIFNKICQKGHWVYKREGIQVGKEVGGGGVGKNWTQNEIAIYDILFFLDCLTLIILEMTGIVILIVKKWRIAHVNNQQHQKLR